MVLVLVETEVFDGAVEVEKLPLEVGVGVEILVPLAVVG